MSEDLVALLAFAERLADAARGVVRRYFRTPVAVDDKADASPVTIADREAERVMRDMIAKAYPDHGVIGEEYGSDRPNASHVWVLDPIDGTKSFITGRPIFGSLIALCRDGRPVASVLEAPAVNERWTGAQGQPTLFKTDHAAPQIVKVRPCPDLAQAAICTTSPHLFDHPDLARFERVRRAVKLPLYGGDCYAYGQLASGFCDLVIEAGLKPYDWAALEPVIVGAGGHLTDWRGAPLDLSAATTYVLAAGDKRAQQAAMALLA